MADDALPPCGLYRTASAHPERTTQVPSGKLVYFHNHSNQDLPIVLLPQDNKNNRWTFNDRGYLVRDAAWCRTLVPQKREGLYTIGETFRSGQATIGAGQIVQLGYNRDADPIIFFPHFDGERNALVFPTQGMKISPEIYEKLQQIDIGGPQVPGRQG